MSKHKFLINIHHTNEDAEKNVVSELRRLADHIEKGGSPYFVDVSTRKELEGSPFTEIKILLSEPWGG